MQPTIVFILGTSYSGSSLLNSLFDAQPRTRGLGEAVHLLQRPTDAWCGGCECPVGDCRLQAKIDDKRFYESVFEAYPNAQVLVNSSKHWGQCFRSMPVPTQSYRLKMVVLSKAMAAFAHSYAAHESCSWDQAFEVWVDFYTQLLRNLDGALNAQPDATPQNVLATRLTDHDIAYVTYRDLALHTDATIGRLCSQLQLPFDPDYRNQLWRGDTCSIGGNNAIYAQRSQNAVFFQAPQEYLGGKYYGRQGAVFYDDAWVREPHLSRAARRFRDLHGATIAALERRLCQLPQTTCEQAQS